MYMGDYLPMPCLYLFLDDTSFEWSFFFYFIGFISDLCCLDLTKLDETKTDISCRCHLGYSFRTET